MVNITDVLHLVPSYLHNIEDYLALTSASRSTRQILSEHSSPHTLLILCYRSQRVFFRPDPLFLLSALARPLSIWARKSTDNLRQLVHSFWYGDKAVVELAISVPAVAIEAKWSLAKVRELWEWRMRVASPLSDLIDKCVGPQWYDVPDFWDGGRADAATLHAEPEETVFRMIIYGELFGDGWEQWITTSKAVTPFASLPTRLEFVKYLLPDWHTPPITTSSSVGIHRGLDVTCFRPYRAGEVETPSQKLVHPTTGHTRIIHPLRAIQTHSGPYRKEDTPEPIVEFQVVLLHLSETSPLWRSIVLEIRQRCGGDFGVRPGHPYASVEDQWKQGLWQNAVYMLGHEGMEMVVQMWEHVRADKQGDVEEAGPGWEKMRRYRKAIAALEEEPEKVQIGAKWTYEVPHLVRDMSVTSWDR